MEDSQFQIDPMATFAFGWRKSLSDFSEIDTSNVATDLSELPGFDDIKEIISNDDSLVNTDYMNQNYFLKKIDDHVHVLPSFICVSDIGSEMEVETEMMLNVDKVEKIADETMKVVKKKKKNKTRGFKCVVCKKGFKDKREMKDHVLMTHLRPTLTCSQCGKGVFQDKLLEHEKRSCPAFV